MLSSSMLITACLTLLLALLHPELSQSSAPGYTSVRALDQFGDSVQLKHAREAASRHGRLVLASKSSSNDVVVVSAGERPLMQLVTLPMNDSEDPVALCCTGIKGDAVWLIDEVQGHAKRVWERYDHHLDANAVSHLAARLCGSFLGQNSEEEWQSSIRREKAEWARPLGIQTLILSHSSPILTMEPSGRVFAHVMAAGDKGDSMRSVGIIGKGSAEIQDKIDRNPPGRMETADLEMYLLGLLCADMPKDEVIIVRIETLSSKGVITRCENVKNGEIIDGRL